MGVGLADSRNALHQYRSNVDKLCPIEEEVVRGLGLDNGKHSTTAGGVHAIIVHDSVWLFTLGSASRGIPQKEWKIPYPLERVAAYSFCPVADVVAFVEQSCVHH